MHGFWLVGILMLVLGGMGCNGDAPVEPIVSDTGTLYWRLEAEHPVIMLSVYAPYDTVQLRAVPKNAFGESLPIKAAVQYRKIVDSDTSFVLGADGFVTAKRSATGARIEVTLTQEGITHGDTITLMIRDESPVRLIDSITLRPGPRDSTWVWAGSTASGASGLGVANWLKAYVEGAILSNSQILVDYSYSDPELFVCGDAARTACEQFGAGYIYVRTYAYGRVLKDSVLFRRIDPTVKVIVISRVFPQDGEPTIVFSPPEVRVHSGTTLFFFNRADLPLVVSLGANAFGNVPRAENATTVIGWIDSVDIVFDDPSVALPGDSYGDMGQLWEGFQVVRFTDPLLGLSGYPTQGVGGNVAPFGHVWQLGGLHRSIDAGWRSRKFTRPGTYHYTSSQYPDVRGTIIVTE